MIPTNNGRLNPRIQELIRERLRRRQERERKQLELLSKEDLWHDQIADKLLTIDQPGWTVVEGETDAWGVRETLGYKRKHAWLENFVRCGQDTITRQCSSCGQRESFTVNCSQKYCPRCQWKLTKARTSLLGKWARHIASPLHLVTTQRNFAILTKSKLREHVQNLGRLRRRKIFKDVRGGTISVEITNEGRGWHLHAHWLIDCDYLDASKVAVEWGKLVGQDFAIVKIKAITNQDYLGEVTKYVAKGNDLASWPAEQIWEFVTAIRGRRFFFTFGALSKLAPEIRRELAQEKPEKQPCDCGCSDFKFVLPTINP